ncbi:MAG: hypothetical protein ISP41_19820 [Alphaproteobacteria bacterium]|nr:hypothetical protein [Alphaproteobacteria bacterium]
MRIAIATLAMLVMTATAQADSLFDKTRLDCVLEYGGEWNFVKFPPELEPLKKKAFAIHSIDFETGTAIAGEGVIGAIRGSRSVVFVSTDTTTTVMARGTPSGYPVIWTNVEAQRAGFCH